MNESMKNYWMPLFLSKLCSEHTHTLWWYLILRLKNNQDLDSHREHLRRRCYICKISETKQGFILAQRVCLKYCTMQGEGRIWDRSPVGYRRCKAKQSRMWHLYHLPWQWAANVAAQSVKELDRIISGSSVWKPKGHIPYLVILHTWKIIPPIVLENVK